METVVTARVSAAEFALSGTFEALPGVQIEAHPIVESGTETVMPVVHARGVGHGSLGEAFESDPSVDRASVLSEPKNEDGRYYWIHWSGDVHRVLRAFTAVDGVILDAWGQQGQWRFRLLYSAQENLSEAYEHWMERGLTVDIERIRRIDRRLSASI